jgi:hypothetical protein
MIVNLVTNTWHIVKKVHNVWKTFVIIIVNVLFISAINYVLSMIEYECNKFGFNQCH